MRRLLHRWATCPSRYGPHRCEMPRWHENLHLAHIGRFDATQWYDKDASR